MLNGDTLVYVTNTGKKYHTKDCCYLRSCNTMKLSNACNLYLPCPNCHPPILRHVTTSVDDRISFRSSILSNTSVDKPFIKLTCNDSIFSFYPNSLHDENKFIPIKSDVYSEEILKKIAVEIVKETYENRVKELESLNLALNGKIARDSLEQFKQNEEKDERICRLEDDVSMLKLQNERMLSLIDDMKDKNDRLTENAAKFSKSNVYVSIESFDFKFLGSNNSDNNVKINCMKDTNESYHDLIEETESLKLKSNENERGHLCKNELDRHDTNTLDIFSERFLKLSNEFVLAKTNKTSFCNYKIPIKMFPVKKRNTTDKIIEVENSQNHTNDSNIEESMSKKEIIEKNESKVCFIDYKNPYIEPKDFKSLLIFINNSNFILKKF